MGLKGIKSLKEARNYITPEIKDFLKQEGFSLAKKSQEPKHSSMTANTQFFKELGGTDHLTYYCFISGSQLVLEFIYIDNGAGGEGLKKNFYDEKTFVNVYNEMVDYYGETVINRG